jgi:hypothetical protein
MFTLKIMSVEQMADDEPAKQFHLVGNLEEISFLRLVDGDDPDGEAHAVAIVRHVGDDEGERYFVPGRAYVMNADGRTVARFDAEEHEFSSRYGKVRPFGPMPVGGEEAEAA